MSVKKRVKTLLPPPYNVAHGWKFSFNGGGGGLEFYTNNRFARSSPVFNNFLITFVPDCSYLGESVETPMVARGHHSTDSS